MHRPLTALLRSLLLAVAMGSLTGCDDDIRANYANAAAARADGAVKRGWLPEALPDSATGITESHNLDTNTGSGSFRFGETDSESFRGGLQSATQSQRERFADHAELQREGYTFHSCPEFVFAIHWQTRKAHFIFDMSSS